MTFDQANRPSGLNVGLSAHFRRSAAMRRRSVHDPSRTFTLGMVVVCNADLAAARLKGLVVL